MVFINRGKPGGGWRFANRGGYGRGILSIERRPAGFDETQTNPASRRATRPGGALAAGLAPQRPPAAEAGALRLVTAAEAAAGAEVAESEAAGAATAAEETAAEEATIAEEAGGAGVATAYTRGGLKPRPRMAPSGAPSRGGTSIAHGGRSHCRNARAKDSGLQLPSMPVTAYATCLLSRRVWAWSQCPACFPDAPGGRPSPASRSAALVTPPASSPHCLAHRRGRAGWEPRWGALGWEIPAQTQAAAAGTISGPRCARAAR